MLLPFCAPHLLYWWSHCRHHYLILLSLRKKIHNQIPLVGEGHMTCSGHASWTQWHAISRPQYLIISLRPSKDLFYPLQYLPTSELEAATSVWIHSEETRHQPAMNTASEIKFRYFNPLRWTEKERVVTAS